jgi:predicted  nucleic acid-binding Zn-ribbon protein
MVWACAKCGTALPEDSEELAVARFCRECGSSYFDTPTDEPGSTSGSLSP